MPLTQEGGIRLLKHIAIADKLEADWISKNTTCKKRRESLSRLIGGTYNIFTPGTQTQDSDGSQQGNMRRQSVPASLTSPTTPVPSSPTSPTTPVLSVAVIGILTDITADEEKKLYRAAKPVLSKLHTTDYDTAKALIGTPRCAEIRNELTITISDFLGKERKMALVQKV